MYDNTRHLNLLFAIPTLLAISCVEAPRELSADEASSERAVLKGVLAVGGVSGRDHGELFASSHLSGMFDPEGGTRGDEADMDLDLTGFATYGERVDGSEGGAPEGELWIEVILSGSGLASECGDSASGMFSATLSGWGDIDEDGVYAASLSNADIRAGSEECDTTDALHLELFSGASVRAMVEATAERCETWCDVEAGAFARSACAGSLHGASCRAEAGAAFVAECERACAEEATWIMAEVDVSAGGFSEAEDLSGSGALHLGMEADLVFDRLADEDGEEVPVECEGWEPEGALDVVGGLF